MVFPGIFELAFSLADAAGKEILGIRRHGLEISRKPDRSWVTQADHAAEAIILRGLREAFPGAVLVSEEDAAANGGQQPAREYWLIDPLDGTRGFARGRDEFAVNIGLVRDGYPVLGVVALPAYNAIYGGAEGLGAWKRTAAGTRPIRARIPPEAAIALASRSGTDDDRVRAFLAPQPIDRIDRFDSAFKFCLVAEGVADFYVRFGPTMEWDTAAPQAVLEAAGGALLRLDGSRFSYGHAKDWRNPEFCCRGALAG